MKKNTKTFGKILIAVAVTGMLIAIIGILYNTIGSNPTDDDVQPVRRRGVTGSPTCELTINGPIVDRRGARMISDQQNIGYHRSPALEQGCYKAGWHHNLPGHGKTRSDIDPVAKSRSLQAGWVFLFLTSLVLFRVGIDSLDDTARWECEEMMFLNCYSKNVPWKEEQVGIWKGKEMMDLRSSEKQSSTPTSWNTPKNKCEASGFSTGHAVAFFFIGVVILMGIIALSMVSSSLESFEIPEGMESHESLYQRRMSQLCGIAVLLLLITALAVIREGLAQLFRIDESGELVDCGLVPHFEYSSENVAEPEIQRTKPRDQSETPVDSFEINMRQRDIDAIAPGPDSRPYLNVR